MGIIHYNGKLTVAQLIQELQKLPQDLYISSHMGKCWTDQIRIQTSTIMDPYNPDSNCSDVLSIAGDSDVQDIWAD